MRRLLLLVIVGLVSCGDASSSYTGYGLGAVTLEDPGLIDEVDAGEVDAGADDSGVQDAGSEVVDGGATVSFAHQIAPILSSKCASCHTFTYSALHNGTRVVPFYPSSSTVYTRTLDGSMPRRGTRLTTVQQRLLFDWISQGALNN
jgi:hypothetical protein